MGSWGQGFLQPFYNRGQRISGEGEGGKNAKSLDFQGFFTSFCFRRPLLYPVELQAQRDFPVRTYSTAPGSRGKLSRPAGSPLCIFFPLS
jgi:hypothetical protein